MKHLRSTNIFNSFTKKAKIENKKPEIVLTTFILIIMVRKKYSNNIIEILCILGKKNLEFVDDKANKSSTVSKLGKE